MVQSHVHRDLEFNLVVSGKMSYLIGGRRVTIGAGHLGVIWAAMSHQSVRDDNEPVRLIWACVPITQALRWQLPGAFVGRLLGEGLVVDTQVNASDQTLLAQWQIDLESGDPLRRQLVTQEIEARLRRLALNVMSEDREASASSQYTDENASSHAGENGGGVQVMAGYIASHYQEPITVQDVADEVMLHPNYAMTVFRKQVGVTINAYITRQRLAHAQRMLVTTDASILDVGLDSGFGSPSRFFQAFKKEVGCSPRAFRLQLGMGGESR